MILPSIVLKRRNCPDNLDFNGKLVAKFLITSHSLSLSLNIKKYDYRLTN